MLNITTNEQDFTVTLEPKEALSEEDFINAKKVIDPFIEKHKKLHGVIIYTKDFPGWDSFTALLGHLKFIKDHHKKVCCIAFVTDSLIGEFSEHITSHFVSAKVKSFPFNALDEAKKWIASTSKS